MRPRPSSQTQGSTSFGRPERLRQPIPPANRLASTGSHRYSSSRSPLPAAATTNTSRMRPRPSSQTQGSTSPGRPERLRQPTPPANRLARTGSHRYSSSRSPLPAETTTDTSGMRPRPSSQTQGSMSPGRPERLRQPTPMTNRLANTGSHRYSSSQSPLPAATTANTLAKGKGLSCSHMRERATEAKVEMGSSEAGTSSECEHQVFLNFRGPDTRSGFTDFLYDGLTDAGIRVFRDSEKLRVGERIDGALQRAIDNSRIYIPIFSQTYASSQWCLRELAQIVENTSRSNGNKEILPIFFDVSPDDIKMKTLLYHNAILNLKRKKKLSIKQVDSWIEALKQVDAIKGWEVKKYDGQAKLIKLVIEEVVVKLKIKQQSVTEHLIGIDDRAIEVRSLLDIDSESVRLIGIHGMGGIGKTTLAKVVFNELSTHFGKCCCFLENVRENSSRTDGLVKLQKKLLSEIGNATGIASIDESEHLMKRIEGTLRDKKVLIVLDDVDNNKQVEKFVGKGALCSGTRVLITTRNGDVFQSTRPKYKMLCYEMKEMSSDHALQLFSRHAFKKDSPSDGFYDISKEIVYATGSLPLTIEVIGSLLYKKAPELWKEKLGELRKAPPQVVFEALKISYNALTFEQRQIFLDIACFFVGEKETNAIYMWEDCKLCPLSGIEVLKNKSLIKIGEGNEFLMHDQLRDLGRRIVHNENPMNPEERSRLWMEDEVLDTIKTKKIMNVQAMVLKLFHAEVHIKSEEGRFEKLRFLKLQGGTFVGDLMDCFPKLRWINWSDFPLKIELTNMCLENIVVLEFDMIACIDDLKLWSLIKEARNLKVLKLSKCDHITRTPDLSGCSTLERLSFRHCPSLRKIHSSVGKLKDLIELTIDRCPLLGLPEEIRDLQKLEHFTLTGCCQMKELPDSIFKLKSLQELELSEIRLDEEGVRQPLNAKLPSEIGLLTQLHRLVLRRFSEIQGLSALPISLTHLEVSSMSLPDVPDLSNLINLVELDLYTDWEVSSMSLPVVPDLSNLANLAELDLFHGSDYDGCEYDDYDGSEYGKPAVIHTGDGSESDDYDGSEFDGSEYGKPAVIHTGDGSESDDYDGSEYDDYDGSEFDGSEYGKPAVIHTGELRWIERLSKLEQLTLHLPHVPAPVELASLPRLSRLYLSGLNLQPLTQVPSSLLKLTLDNFDSIALLSFNYSENLSDLSLTHSQMKEIILDGLQLPNLTGLYVRKCDPLKTLKLSSMRKLKEVAVWNCQKLDEICITGVLESLERLKIEVCGSFRRFEYVESFRGFEYVDIHGESSHISSLILESKVFNKLRCLSLSNCHNIHSIQVIGMSESLEDLVLSGDHLQSLGGLSNLKNLKSLRIHSGPKLQIVEGLDELKFFNELTLGHCHCESLIDVLTTGLPNDCFLHIHDSPKLLGVKQEFFGSVQSFKRYKEEESVWAACMDPLRVWSVEDSAQERYRVPGTIEELLAAFEINSHR